MNQMDHSVGQLVLTNTCPDEPLIGADDVVDRHGMRGTEGVTRFIEQEAIRPREAKEAIMATEFLTQAKDAVRLLQRAQQQRERHERVARERYDTARQEYHRAVSRAAALEAKAWVRLLDVPGMSVRTAATLGGVSVATVHRRLKEARDV